MSILLFSVCRTTNKIYEDAISAYIRDVYSFNNSSIPPYKIIFKAMEEESETESVPAELISNKIFGTVESVNAEELRRLEEFLGQKQIPLSEVKRNSDMRMSFPISARQARIIEYTKTDSVLDIRKVQCVLYLKGETEKWEFPVFAGFELSQDGELCFGTYEIKEPLIQSD